MQKASDSVSDSDDLGHSVQFEDSVLKIHAPNTFSSAVK